MPTPEERRAIAAKSQRRYYAKNRDHILDDLRTDPVKRDKKRLLYKDWAERNPERRRELTRRSKQGRRSEGYKDRQVRLRKELVAQLWNEQQGRCFLCEEPVSLERAILEHDHRCCPNRFFCRYCVRGAACGSCNTAIGSLCDDPDRMERVARNLRTKLAEIDQRLEAKPQQLNLEISA